MPPYLLFITVKLWLLIIFQTQYIVTYPYIAIRNQFMRIISQNFEIVDQVFVIYVWVSVF